MLDSFPDWEVPKTSDIGESITTLSKSCKEYSKEWLFERIVFSNEIR